MCFTWKPPLTVVAALLFPLVGGSSGGRRVHSDLRAVSLLFRGHKMIE